MKLLSKTMFGMLLTLSATAAVAQSKDSRQKLFDAYPQNIDVERSLFSTTLNFEEGQSVTVPFNNQFHLNGIVISNQKKFGGIQTVIIRTADNSLFQVTAISNNSNKSVSYGGRILNQNSADGYEIKNNNGAYALNKFETSKIFEPCKL